jgi:hypothetical protein
MRHGSHIIAIGLVVGVHGTGGAPLAYHRGGYHHLEQHEVSMRF